MLSKMLDQHAVISFCGSCVEDMLSAGRLPSVDSARAAVGANNRSRSLAASRFADCSCAACAAAARVSAASSLLRVSSSSLICRPWCAAAAHASRYDGFSSSGCPLLSCACEHDAIRPSINDFWFSAGMSSAVSQELDHVTDLLVELVLVLLD